VRQIAIGIYHPGASLLHRIPAGPKLGLLFVYGIAVVVASGPWPVLGAVAVSTAMALHARLPPRTIVRGLRPILIVMILLGGFQWWQRGWPVAVEAVGTVVALVIASLVFTATTSSDRMLDAIVRGLTPFRRVGADPEKVALAFSLMITSIPRISAIADETRDAARARGLGRSPRAYLTPMAIRSVAHAHLVGEALHARGIGDGDG
jgi:biotin transport system permease protein